MFTFSCSVENPSSTGKIGRPKSAPKIRAPRSLSPSSHRRIAGARVYRTALVPWQYIQSIRSSLLEQHCYHSAIFDGETHSIYQEKT